MTMALVNQEPVIASGDGDKAKAKNLAEIVIGDIEIDLSEILTDHLVLV